MYESFALRYDILQKVSMPTHRCLEEFKENRRNPMYRKNLNTLDDFRPIVKLQDLWRMAMFLWVNFNPILYNK